MQPGKSDGRPAGWPLGPTDGRPRAADEEELGEAKNRLEDRLIATLAHEQRNPLAWIMTVLRVPARSPR